MLLAAAVQVLLPNGCQALRPVGRDNGCTNKGAAVVARVALSLQQCFQVSFYKTVDVSLIMLFITRQLPDLFPLTSVSAVHHAGILCITRLKAQTIAALVGNQLQQLVFAGLGVFIQRMHACTRH